MLHCRITYGEKVKMATYEEVDEAKIEKINANMARVEALTERLVQAFSNKKPANPTLNAPGQDLMAQAAVSMWAEVLENPGKMYEQQLEYWGKSVRHFMEAQQNLARAHLAQVGRHDS